MKNRIYIFLTFISLGLALAQPAEAQVPNRNRTQYYEPQIFDDTCYFKINAAGSAGKVLTSGGDGGNAYWAPAGSSCTCDTINADSITAHLFRGGNGVFDTMQTGAIRLTGGGGGPTQNTLPLLRDTSTGLVSNDTCGYWSLCGNAGTDPTAQFLGTTDGQNLIIQPGAGNVGIGTTTPTAKLHILQADSGGIITEASTTYGGEVTRYHLKVHLDSTQIRNANSSPIDIGLPASGAGYYYRVTAFDAKLIYGTTPFVSENLQIGTSNINTQFVINGILTAIQNTFESGQKPTSGLEENATIVISADNDSVDGDSTIDCFITVEKVKL